MLHTYFYIPAGGNGHQNTNDHTQRSNFMNIYDTDHSDNTLKPYLAVEEKNETENTEADFISFYDIFGAVNY